MPNYKALKSVAHNLGHSYLSLMNHDGLDYVVEHLFKTARRRGITHVEIDVLNGSISPAEMHSRPILDSVKRERDDFPRFLASNQCSVEQVRSAVIKIDYRFADTRPSPHVPNLELAAYDCEVEIIDDRGKVWMARVPEWWRY
jgi:hypothetical protein